ncbi:aspartyl-phosphate phosphatase Spo0E family protein [Paenibacillus thermotolerans]|uniref:aspartyl-phosphate phosphatase Spo0E family protein n=1 Tax=Paenibacillus thermotolerans TaxID=3027807 RepID=UPI002368F044|nr:MULTISPECIES: aspartyl-phosphate phosphatase Spo0E family protein [unclassified Paenibacillus]
MSEQQLRDIIEKTRTEMIKVAAEKGCLFDQHVIEISGKLDLLILQHQRISRISKLRQSALLIETPA